MLVLVGWFRRFGIDVSVAATALLVLTIVVHVVGASAKHSRELVLLPDHPTYSIDAVIYDGGSRTLGGERVRRLTLPVGKVMTVAGWAVDREAGRVANGVTLLVDGTKPVQAQYGVRRDDVARALGDVAYAESGFIARINPPMLGLGSHRIGIVVDSSDGTGFYRVDDVLELTVRR